MASNEEIVKFLSLSKREREALSHFCKGLSYKEIAEKMVIEPGAVSSYMSRAYKKLGLFELSQIERFRNLAEIYSPLFDVDLEEPEDQPEEVFDAQTNALIVLGESIEIPSPEEENILNADEKALVALHQGPQSAKSMRQNEAKPKRRGCRVFLRRLFTLLVVILVALGGIGWYLWQNDDLDMLPFDVSEIVSIPQALAEEYFGESTRDANPTQRPTTNSSGETTDTPVPTPTSTPPPTSTPVPTSTSTPPPTSTPVPTSTITPAPGGIDTWVGDEDFQIKLLDYEYRSAANEEDEGAVNVFLSFINNTSNPVEVQINWYIAEGVDNVGIKYGEIQSVGDRYISWSNAQEKLENWSMVVPANSIELLDFELHVEGNNAGHITRVDIRTDWIDFKIPSIIYRTDELNQVKGLWRLDR